MQQPDQEPRFRRQCKRQISDPARLERTLSFFEFAKTLNERPQWGEAGNKTMTYLVRMPLTKRDGGGEVFAVRSDGVVQIWINEVTSKVPAEVSLWFNNTVKNWPELAQKGKSNPVFHLDKHLTTDDDFERFTSLFVELRTRLSSVSG